MIRAVLFALLVGGAAWAVEPGERLADPALEARARALGQGLRCQVCQNESIDESNAELARDVRARLRERLVAGDSDAAARDYIVARYGTFVLLEPPVEPATYLLWFGPGVLLVAALGGVGLAARRRRAGPVPLDAAEQARLAELLGQDGA